MLNVENKYEELQLKSYCDFSLDKEDKIVIVSESFILTKRAEFPG